MRLRAFKTFALLLVLAITCATGMVQRPRSMSLGLSAVQPDGVAFLLFGIPFFIVGFLLYWLPTIIAFCRNHHNRTAIAVVNLLLGWSIVGWIVALIWAFTSPPPGVVARGQ